MNCETELEIQYWVAHRYFGTRRNIIIPNLSWGMFNYELDLCVLNCKSLYAQEVEIKISKADLKRDKEKWKWQYPGYNYDLIRQIWFAMPLKLKDCIELVPEKAGIIFLDCKGYPHMERRPKINPVAKRWTLEQAFNLGRLGTMRMWNLKRKSEVKS
jgi:hypothetical protein